MTTMTMDMMTMSDLLNSRVPLSDANKPEPAPLDANREKVELDGSNLSTGLDGNDDGAPIGSVSSSSQVASAGSSIKQTDALSDIPNIGKVANKNAASASKRKILEKSWMRPALVSTGVGIVVLSGVLISFGGNNAVKPKENASAIMNIATDTDGKDALNVEQAQYLSEKQRAQAQANAENGVTNAAIVTEITASAPQNSYLTTNTSDVSAITSEKKDVPMTMAQLEAKPDRYSKTITDANKIYFTDKVTGKIIYPSDGVAQEALLRQSKFNQSNTAPSNATAYTANGGGAGGGYNGGAGGGGYNGGAGGNGGNPQGVATDNQNQQQSQPPQPDADLAKIKQTLYDDYEARIRENQAYQDALAQQQQAYMAQQQQVVTARQQQAQAAISAAMQQNTQSMGASNTFTAQSYNKPQQAQRYGNTQPATTTLYDAQGNPVQVPVSQLNGNTGGMVNPSNIGGVGNFNYTDNNVTLSPTGELTNTATPQTMRVGYGSSTNGAGNNLTANGLLPANIIRAGTTWQMVVTKSVNTDEGLQVVGELITGKFAGAKIYGFAVPQGRSIGVNFTQILPKNPRKPIIPINAAATTIGSEKSAVATDKNNHYFQNYGVTVLTSAFEGYGEAYSNAGTTVIAQSDGTVIKTTEGEVSDKQINGEILNRVGSRLNADIAKLGDRPPTFKIAQGSVLNVVLTQNLDVTNTTNSLSSTGFGSGLTQ